MQGKLKDFANSPWTWGAIGVLTGVLIPLIPVANFFILAWLILTVSVFMTALSGTTSIFRPLLVSAACSMVLAAALWAAYRYVPKPPTIADMTVEILNRVPGLADALARSRVSSESARTEQSKQPFSFGLRFKPPTASEIADEVAKRLSVAQESRLRAMAPRIVAEMQSWLDKWVPEESELRGRSAGTNGFHLSPQDREHLAEQYLNMNKDYTSKILPVMTNADNLRRNLLEGSVLTQEDQQNAAIFAKVLAGDPIGVNDLRGITYYMQNLVKRLIPSSPQ